MERCYFNYKGFTATNGEQIKIIKEPVITYPKIFRTDRKIHVRIVDRHAEIRIEYLPDRSPEQWLSKYSSEAPLICIKNCKILQPIINCDLGNLKIQLLISHI
jgi:hypothetical protein